MKNIWSVICEKSSIDSQTNILSLFNCIEELKIEINKNKISKDSKMIIPVNFQLISLWLIDNYNKENAAEIKIELIDPSGKVLNESVNTLKTKVGEKRLRSVINISGLELTEAGIYYYRISQKIGKKFEFASETPVYVDLSYQILDIK